MCWLTGIFMYPWQLLGIFIIHWEKIAAKSPKKRNNNKQNKHDFLKLTQLHYFLKQLQGGVVMAPLISECTHEQLIYTKGVQGQV